MSLERTPQGTWRARWRDNQGKTQSKTFKRKPDAVAFLRDTLVDLRRGHYIDTTAGRITVTTFADEWLNGARNLGRGGHDTYRRDLDRHIIPNVGDYTLRRLTPDVIDTYLADELEAGLAASTVHRHYRTLRRMLQVAVERGKLPRNPCDLVVPPKIVTDPMRVLTVDEVERLAAVIDKRYRAWVLVAAYGGLRWSEAVGLRRSRVDGVRVTVAEQLVRRGDGVWDRAEPKTVAGRRVVTLPESVGFVLAEHLGEWSEVGPDGLVFPNRGGRPLNGPSFRGTVFASALRRAKIEDRVRIHDLRHTAVALAIAAGGHPKAIQARLGHASISVTLDRYGHLFPVLDVDLAARLDELRP